MEGKNSHNQSSLTLAFTVWNMPSALCLRINIFYQMFQSKSVLLFRSKINKTKVNAGSGKATEISSMKNISKFFMLGSFILIGL